MLFGEADDVIGGGEVAAKRLFKATELFKAELGGIVVAGPEPKSSPSRRSSKLSAFALSAFEDARESSYAAKLSRP